MTDAPDPLSPFVRDTLSLFARELADQRFGDVDAAELEALAERTRARAAEVQRAREALDEALAGLEQSRSALTRRAEQALEYARIFARGDDALTAEVEALDAHRAPKKKKRRRKASKAKPEPEPAGADVAELPFEARTG